MRIRDVKVLLDLLTLSFVDTVGHKKNQILSNVEIFSTNSEEKWFGRRYTLCNISAVYSHLNGYMPTYSVMSFICFINDFFFSKNNNKQTKVKK